MASKIPYAAFKKTKIIQPQSHLMLLMIVFVFSLSCDGGSLLFLRLAVVVLCLFLSVLWLGWVSLGFQSCGCGVLFVFLSCGGGGYLLFHCLAVVVFFVFFCLVVGMGLFCFSVLRLLWCFCLWFVCDGL